MGLWCLALGMHRGCGQGLTCTRAAWGPVPEAGDVCVQWNTMVLWGRGCGAGL